MKLLSVAVAKSVWLFDMNDLNPGGKSFFPALMTWLKERYGFQTVPASPTDVDKKTNGLMFLQGQFHGEGETVNVNLGIYTDGLVAETWSSTKDGDLFLEDVLRSASKEFGLAYSPEIVRAKRYVSELVVRLDPPLGNLNPKVAAFSEKLSRMFERAHLPDFEFAGFGFYTDTSASSYKAPGFIVERRTDTPFSERRYYSKSPFTTEEHISALENVEGLLSDAPEK